MIYSKSINNYLIFQLIRSFWKSDAAITSSATCGEGPAGGQAMRNSRILLQSSVLYMDAERFGRSKKLQINIERENLEP